VPIELEDDEPAVAEPAVPDVALLPDPIVAFVRMYDPAGVAADEVDPDVPVDPAPPALPPSCTQPVTVTVLPPLALLLGLCGFGSCAAAPTTNAVTTAIPVAVHV